MKPLFDLESHSFLELFGALVGDGCLVRFKRKDAGGLVAYRIFITGNATTDLQYFKNYLQPLLTELGVNSYLHLRKPTNVKNVNTVDLVINNKEFALILVKVGFPIGKKGQIRLPDWIVALQLVKKLRVVRGIFDTDGCFAARKSEGYRRPFAIISSSSEPLRLQIKAILREAGFSAYESGHIVGVNGIANTKNWFSFVGSSNPRNISRYEAWVESGRMSILAK
jgi:intein/homing endonuclease